MVAHELFEVVGRGIGEAALLIDHGAAPDAKPVSYFGLRQPEPAAHGQHQLPKGVVSLAVRGSLHISSPSHKCCDVKACAVRKCCDVR